MVNKKQWGWTAVAIILLTGVGWYLYLIAGIGSTKLTDATNVAVADLKLGTCREAWSEESNDTPPLYREWQDVLSSVHPEKEVAMGHRELMVCRVSDGSYLVAAVLGLPSATSDNEAEQRIMWFDRGKGLIKQTPAMQIKVWPGYVGTPAMDSLEGGVLSFGLGMGDAGFRSTDYYDLNLMTLRYTYAETRCWEMVADKDEFVEYECEDEPWRE